MVRAGRGRGAGRLPPPPLMSRNNGMPPMRYIPPGMRPLPPGMRSPPFAPHMPPHPPPSHMRGLPHRLPPGPPMMPHHPHRNMPPFPPRPPMMFRGPMLPPGPMRDPHLRRMPPPPLMGGRIQGAVGKKRGGQIRRDFRGKNRKGKMEGRPWEARKPKNPWITEEVLKLIEERRKFWNSPDEAGKKRFNALKNEITRKSKKAKEQWLEQQKSKENGGKTEVSKNGTNEINTNGSVKEQENNGIDASKVDEPNKVGEAIVDGADNVDSTNGSNAEEITKVEIAA